MSELICATPQRRADARAAGWCGLDAITVGADPRTLTVTLFGPAPDDLTASSFSLTGPGRPVQVVAVNSEGDANGDPDGSDCLILTVDRPGDRSTYQLCVVASDARGRPGTAPHPGFDPRCACLDFSFAQNCPGLLDCLPAPCGPPATPQEPVIDYLAKDYASFRRLMLERLSQTVPGWTEQHVPDIGIALVELLAYAVDRLSYRQDAIATEAYLDTARLRVSVHRHARLVDYRMHDGCAARAVVCLQVGADTTVSADDARFYAGDAVFVPLAAEELLLRKAHNQMSLWTWGDEDCCLPAGATSATLCDEGLQLAEGDLLVFEEIRGPVTGAKADADPTHRQAVRLTSVQSGVDPLYEQKVVDVSWATADALTFPLCVSARGGPDCALLEVAVARGNAVLVEHGNPVRQQVTLPVPDELDTVDCAAPEWGCPEPGGTPRPAQAQTVRVGQPHVTRTEPFPRPADIGHDQARWLRGIPDRARAAVRAMLDDGPDDALLRTLFGPKALRAAGLHRHPQSAVLALLDRFDELLGVKLDRIAELAARAQAGYVLAADVEGWEVGQAWGIADGAGLDPARPAFRGPVVAALTTDPRASLPALTVVVDGDDRPWRPRADLLASGPSDRDVVGDVDDNDVTTLRFGDGSAGALPPVGATVQIAYRYGNGTAGNVAAEAIDSVTFATARGVDVSAVCNPLPATGGVDPEPVATVRAAAPGSAVRTLERAVTAADYATLAEARPGVQRAAAELRWTGSWYEARVAIDAMGTETAPQSLLVDERANLHRYRRIGHTLSVTPAIMVPLRLALCVLARPGYVAGHVRAAVLTALGALFAPDALTFGTPVRISAIVAAVVALPGVRAAEVTTLERLFDAPGDAHDTGVLVLRPDEIAQLDNDPAHPERGLIELTVGGGR